MSVNFPFYKIQGCANDFIVCELSNLPSGLITSPNAIIELCDRHVGIGSDGLLVLGPRNADTIEVLMFNPDGTEMDMCGNGIRCVVRYLFLKASSEKLPEQFNFLVSGRKIGCVTKDRGLNVEVNMGEPSFDPKLVPIKAGHVFQNEDLQVDEHKIRGWALSMGNPHFVTFVDKLDANYAKDIGFKVEHNPLFPKRTNVEFVRVLTRKKIEILVWERGAGFTMACGTGACAAVVAGILSGALDSPCKVVLPGGLLEVNWDSSEKNASVFLLGPAKEVFSGIWSESN